MINVIGALALIPECKTIRLVTQSHRHSLTGEQIIAFLTGLLRAIRGPNALVRDNALICVGKLFREFIVVPLRLTEFNIASCAPELNPVEFVWTQPSEVLAGRAPMQITGPPDWSILDCNGRGCRETADGHFSVARRFVYWHGGISVERFGEK